MYDAECFLLSGSIDWCCFYYFIRNSLVALLEALHAQKSASKERETLIQSKWPKRKRSLDANLPTPMLSKSFCEAALLVCVSLIQMALVSDGTQPVEATQSWEQISGVSVNLFTFWHMPWSKVFGRSCISCMLIWCLFQLLWPMLSVCTMYRLCWHKIYQVEQDLISCGTGFEVYTLWHLYTSMVDSQSQNNFFFKKQSALLAHTSTLERTTKLGLISDIEEIPILGTKYDDGCDRMAGEGCKGLSLFNLESETVSFSLARSRMLSVRVSVLTSLWLLRMRSPSRWPSHPHKLSLCPPPLAPSPLPSFFCSPLFLWYDFCLQFSWTNHRKNFLFLSQCVVHLFFEFFWWCLCTCVNSNAHMCVYVCM